MFFFFFFFFFFFLKLTPIVKGVKAGSHESVSVHQNGAVRRKRILRYYIASRMCPLFTGK